MFDQILDLVKEHIGSNPQIASSIPADKKEQVNEEIASHIDTGIRQNALGQGGIGGLLSSLAGGLTNGSPVGGAIEGGLVSSLGSKFGLPPAVTGAIAGALPGILAKFAGKANDPNDNSITLESITKSIGGNLGGLGSIFGMGK